MIKMVRAVGWMCDFGEYMPMDVSYSNFIEPAQNYHNRYPYEWAKLSQKLSQEAV